MNILIPDSWLRDFLKTSATPKEIKKFLSLCGPSVERINQTGEEIVYEIEITGNRPDMMSVAGIAREAATILPRFGIPAKMVGDPYQTDYKKKLKEFPKSKIKKLNIISDAELNPRWTSFIIDDVKIKESPKWLQKRLELSGIRALNNVIDVTNYLMLAYGQPAHAFDFSRILPDKTGVPFMKLRPARKGEQITTLDGKTHTLSGGDIVIEDGSGRLIDLCGIMGAQNSSIRPTTKTVLLFMQTYAPALIRRTMMQLSHRTIAGSLFEKGPDSELVLPAVIEGSKMIAELTGGKIASGIMDIYPYPYKPYKVSCSRQKLDTYLGTKISDAVILQILTALGFVPGILPDKIEVRIPSFRRDIKIDVDIIEEIARIYGYHNLTSKLPDSEPPVTFPDAELRWEEEVKIRLRDWGFTEIYSYSMIPESTLDIFQIDKTKTYKIANPLSSEWVYLRPHLFLSVLNCVKENLHFRSDFKLFELSHAYEFRPNDLPREKPALIVVWTGNKFLEAKGIAEALFHLFGIDFSLQNSNQNSNIPDIYTNLKLHFGEFGSVGIIKPEILTKFGIDKQITRLYLDFDELVKNVNIQRRYHPISKFLPVIEDLTFVFPLQTFIGNVMSYMKSVTPVIYDIKLIGQYENASTFRIYFLDSQNQLTSADVKPIREKIIGLLEQKFRGKFKD